MRFWTPVLVAVVFGACTLVGWYAGGCLTEPAPRSVADWAAWSASIALGAGIGAALVLSAGWPWLVTR